MQITCKLGVIVRSLLIGATEVAHQTGVAELVHPTGALWRLCAASAAGRTIYSIAMVCLPAFAATWA